MSEYKITTDTTSDLTVEFLSEYGIPAVSIPYSVNGVEYNPLSGGMPMSDFYAAMRAGSAPITRLANSADHIQVFEPLLKKGMDVIHIAFSSALSGTCNSAYMAAQELLDRYPDRKIKVIDSLCASLGEGLLVTLATEKQKQGLSFDEMAGWIEETKMHLCHWVVVDDLFHLQRGGRISKTTAIVGSMIGMKPIIHMDNEGRLVSVGKERGKLKAMKRIVETMAETAVNPAEQLVYISHCDCEPEARQLADMVRERLGVKNIHIGYIGPTIGSHIGPGTMALFFVGTHR